MKIKVETTIPTGRQYENIKTSYEADASVGGEEVRDRLHELAIEDCKKLHGCVSGYRPSVEEKGSVKRISVFGGVYVYDEKEDRWNKEQEQKKEKKNG